MAYYETPADMYQSRANQAERMADRYWAMAKNGEGDQYYGMAKKYYQGAQENAERAEKARQGNNSW